MYSRFDTIPECDRHTDTQTDGHTTTAYTVLSIASRSKNVINLTEQLCSICSIS